MAGNQACPNGLNDMVDTYAYDIARAADRPHITPQALREAQAAMWARHHVVGWSDGARRARVVFNDCTFIGE